MRWSSYREFIRDGGFHRWYQSLGRDPYERMEEYRRWGAANCFRLDHKELVGTFEGARRRAEQHQTSNVPETTFMFRLDCQLSFALDRCSQKEIVTACARGSFKEYQFADQREAQINVLKAIHHLLAWVHFAPSSVFDFDEDELYPTD